jgi:hypothetical protein
MPSVPVLIAIVVACLSGWATRFHCRMLMGQGMGMADGGGFAVLILLEFTACMSAVGVALNL